MGYHLKPKNKELDYFSFGAFSWSWLLKSGAGLAVNVTRGLEPSSYYYIPDKKGRSPQSNDGYYVTSKNAKLMAQLTRVIVNGEHIFARDWEKLSDDRKNFFSNSLGIQGAVRDDFLDRAEQFADWAEKSKGFWIY